jgi:cytochrome c5
VERLVSSPAKVTGGAMRVGKIVLAVIAVVLAALVAIIEFPDQAGSILPHFIAQFLPPPLPALPPTREAHWLDQNWSTEDRHWFHHASQGTATFPVPYSWFVALEQPGIHLFTQPGLMKDSQYLERFGFLPSPQTIHADAAALGHYGYPPSPKTAPAPASVENFDGLPVGFARLTGAVNPGTGQGESDKIGLTCAACHAGSIRYKGVSVRFDGGPAMVDLKKLESATGLSIGYTLIVPGRFKRFATRVLGPGAGEAERGKLKEELTATLKFLFNQVKVYNKTIGGMKDYDGKPQKDTEEGFGRLDALNRIGNQVFYVDLATAGLAGLEKNLHSQDAPVSFPPIWTVPWFLWAQYDASIEQPMIRNAGEALGVYALVNFSPNTPPEALFRSTVAVETLDRIEAMLRGPNPASQNPAGFAGLSSPKWPAQLFPGDDAWKIDPARVEKGRAVYAEICVECHLGPVDDPVFDKKYPEKSFWTSKRWNAAKGVVDLVQKDVAGMGTDPAQAEVLWKRKVDVPGFLNMQPQEILGKGWGCKDMPAASTEMPYSLALMMAVDRVSNKWMDDRSLTGDARKALWGPRKNCPNPNDESEYQDKPTQDAAKPAASAEWKPQYRARPLNGVWATAPYLHNGSVPSLYWMLRPAAERPKKFCMGFRDFDPEQVGFRVAADGESSCKTGETLFSTTDSAGPIHGNSNLGHSLEAKPGEGAHEHKNGVIGRLLSDEERTDLIEYLKTL